MLRNLIRIAWFTLILFVLGCQFAPPAQIATGDLTPVALADSAQADSAQADSAQEKETPDNPQAADETDTGPQTDDETAADETAVEDQDADAADEQEDEGDQEESEAGVIKAYFLAEVEHPISARPEEWTSELRVEEAVPHGATVEQGEVLIRFNTRKFDQAHEDQEHSVTTARLAFEKAQLELDQLRKSTRMSLAESQRVEEYATQDLKRFVTTERDQRKEAIEFNTRSAEDYLAYEEEELKQLTKMYEADDLTEETEEIVLRRTRDDVRRSRHRLMTTRQSMERAFEVELPRSQERLEVALKKASLEREKTAAMAEAEIAEKEIDLEKRRRELHRAEERLSRLNADQKWLTLKAPASGLVYYGEQQFGKWPNPSQIAASLKPGGTAKPYRVLMTVVQPAVGRVVGTMDEADFPYVSEDRTGKLVISAFPELECKASVVEISPIPVADGKFLVTMQPSLPADVPRLVPGMTCEVTFEKSE